MKYETPVTDVLFSDPSITDAQIRAWCAEIETQNAKLREALGKIAAMPTDQLASPNQCAAVILATDALGSWETE